MEKLLDSILNPLVDIIGGLNPGRSKTVSFTDGIGRWAITIPSTLAVVAMLMGMPFDEASATTALTEAIASIEALVNQAIETYGKILVALGVLLNPFIRRLRLRNTAPVDSDGNRTT